MTTVQVRQGEAVVYYSPTETAAEIRKVLAAEFPGTKFSVKTRKYAGGSSVDVYYWDGPAYDAVKRAIGCMHGASFDGMTDSTSHHTSEHNGQKVRWGADYLSVYRNLTREPVEAAAAETNRLFGAELLTVSGSDSWGWSASANCAPGVDWPDALSAERRNRARLAATNLDTGDTEEGWWS